MILNGSEICHNTIKRDKWYLLTFLMPRMSSTQKMNTEFEVISVTFFESS